VKADGNLLWVTVVLDTVYEQLADGQSVTEVMRYTDGIPQDVEQYYYNLVYTRIHTTYRTGKVSECAMALKIMTCMINSPWLGHYRFQLIWELQISIATGGGVAYDTAFCTKPSSPETSKPLDEDGYQSVCAFVRSRCKDLMVTSRDHHGGHLDYQHRVITYTTSSSPGKCSRH